MKKLVIFTLLTVVATAKSLAAEPEIAEIRLAAQPEMGLGGQRGKGVESSKHISKFRLVPGLVDPRNVSLELIGAKGFFVRHQNSQLFVHDRPKANSLFNADATFKLIRLEGDKVRFEASNYPGMFITVRDDGAVITARNPDPLKSTFITKK